MKNGMRILGSAGGIWDILRGSRMGWRGLGSPQEEIWGGIGVTPIYMGWGVWGHPKKDGMKILGSPEGFWGILRGRRMGWRDLGSPQRGEGWDEDFGVTWRFWGILRGRRMGWGGLGSPQEEIWDGIGVILRNMGWRGFGVTPKRRRMGWGLLGSPWGIWGTS